MPKTEIIIAALGAGFIIASIASHAYVWFQKPIGIYAIVGLRTAIASQWSAFLSGCAFIMFAVDMDEITLRAVWGLFAILWFFRSLRYQREVQRLIFENSLHGDIPPNVVPQAP